MKKDAPHSGGLVLFEWPDNRPPQSWFKLSAKKQETIREINSRILARDRQQEQIRLLGEFGRMMDIRATEDLLEGEEYTTLDNLRALYADAHFTTVYRKYKAYKELSAKLPESFFKELQKLDANVLIQFDRIARASLGDIRNALQKIPALPSSTQKDAKEILEAVEEKLSEDRQSRARSAHETINKQTAMNMFVNAGNRLMRQAGLKTSQQKSHFLQTACGWLMEAQAVPGTLRIHRTPIPDGVIVSRGRPRLKPGEKGRYTKRIKPE